jgi:branched-chain amino acid aminotransferase
MQGYINLNGTICKADENHFHHSNRSLRYGDGVFESMIMFGGKVKLLDLHAARIEEAARTLRFQLPSGLQGQNLYKEIGRLAKAYDAQNARIRIMIYRKPGGFYAPENDEAEYLVELVKIEHSAFQWSEKGLKLGVYEENRKAVSTYSHLKTCNSLLYVMAGMYKDEKGFDECVILNTDNKICEAISCNIFWVKNRTVLTPSRESGCIMGVMRSWLTQKITGTGYILEEGLFSLDEMMNADEIFLTNASQGMQWVEAYDSRVYSNSFSRSLFSELLIG